MIHLLIKWVVWNIQVIIQFLDKKSKSISIDFTYFDDEVLSNRKKSEMLIKQTLVKRKENKKNDNNYIKEDFLSFYEEMNKKLFGMGK